MASDDNLRGVLFREQNKKSEKSPDFTGHLTIDGVRYRLAGWTREERRAQVSQPRCLIARGAAPAA